MIPPASVLPRALQKIATDTGLIYPVKFGDRMVPYPIAAKHLPVFKDPVDAVSRLPMQMNFAREELNMDDPEDQAEYHRIMNYYQAGYGMVITYHERKFIRKWHEGKCRIVQRIFLEYFAPYKVLTADADS